MFATECCSVVGLRLGLGLCVDLVSGMHTEFILQCNFRRLCHSPATIDEKNAATVFISPLFLSCCMPIVVINDCMHE